MPAWSRLLVIPLIVLLLASPRPVWAQSADFSPLLERKIKAAYLYKFANYIEWPPEAGTHADKPLVIGVIGADALAADLEGAAAGATVGGHPVTVRKLGASDALTGLHILFIGYKDKSAILDVLGKIKGQPTLTVTDAGAEDAPDSAINFVLVDDRVRFEVAPTAAQFAGLRISARMLTAAYRVRQ